MNFTEVQYNLSRVMQCSPYVRVCRFIGFLTDFDPGFALFVRQPVEEPRLPQRRLLLRFPRGLHVVLHGSLRPLSRRIPRNIRMAVRNRNRVSVSH